MEIHNLNSLLDYMFVLENDFYDSLIASLGCAWRNNTCTVLNMKMCNRNLQIDFVTCGFSYNDVFVTQQ